MSVARRDDLLAQERGDDHGVGEVEAGAVLEDHAALVDVVDGGVDHRGDPLLAHEHAQQLLAVRQAADAEVPQLGLGCHVRQLDLLLETGLAELVGHVEEVLVGGAEATCSLGGADDDVTGGVEEPAPAPPGPLGVEKRGDRVGVAARSQPLDRVEVVAVAGGDHQVVVRRSARRGLDLLRPQVELRCLGVDEVDAVRVEGRGQWERDVTRRPLPERQPDQRGVEQEPVRRRHHPDVHVAVQLVLHRQRGGQPAEVPTQHQHLLARHLRLPSSVGRRLRRFYGGPSTRRQGPSTPLTRPSPLFPG